MQVDRLQRGDDPQHPRDRVADASGRLDRHVERLGRRLSVDTYYGQSFVQFAPLFGHEYSHVWIDFRGIRDAYMQGRGIDYFENSRRAALAQRGYGIANPGGWRGYGANVWA